MTKAIDLAAIAVMQKADHDALDTAVTKEAAGFVSLNPWVPVPIKGTYTQVPYVKGATYWIDSYDGPHGPGYIVWQEQTLGDGTVQHQGINVGPETWQDTKGWVTVSAAPAVGVPTDVVTEEQVVLGLAIT